MTVPVVVRLAAAAPAPLASLGADRVTLDPARRQRVGLTLLAFPTAGSAGCR